MSRTDRLRPRLKVAANGLGYWGWLVYTRDGGTVHLHRIGAAHSQPEALAVGLAALEVASVGRV